jgi:hypothetical protein
MGKFIFKSFGIIAVVLLGFTLYQATLTGHASNAPGALSAGSGSLQSTLNNVGPASDRTISEFAANLQTYINSGSNFLSRNGTRAHTELAIMAQSLPSTFGNWLPKNSSNWLQSTAQAASQAAGNKPGAVARKIPVVNSALNATKERIAAVGQSLNGAASGF